MIKESIKHKNRVVTHTDIHATFPNDYAKKQGYAIPARLYNGL